MLLIEKVLFLRHVPLFASMTLDDLQRLAEIASERAVGSETTIIKQGEHGDRLFLIVEGDVRVHAGDRTLAQLGPRRYFGELSIIDGESRSASVTTRSDCLFLEIDRDGFHTLLLRHPSFAREVILALTRDLRLARGTQQ